MARPVFSAQRSSGLLSVVWLALFSIGCARSALPPVDDAVREYERATAKRDAAALHALLSEEARVAYDEAAIERLLESDGAALAAASRSLAREDRTMEIEVLLHFADREVIELDGEDGEFRVSSARTLPLRTETPEALVRALGRALEARDLDLVLRLSTESRRARFEEEFDALGVSLDHPEEAVIDVRGDRALVHLRDGRTLELRREHGGWRIEEVK